jgi:ligand-binding sensor domain-containing protein
MWLVWQALALDPQASNYLRTDLTVEEGLPDHEVNTIVQTRNGFLWVGTDGGLDYFDRSLVTMYHPGVGSSDRITWLLIRNGMLWVGTCRGLYRCLSAFKPSA